MHHRRFRTNFCFSFKGPVSVIVLLLFALVQCVLAGSSNTPSGEGGSCGKPDLETEKRIIAALKSLSVTVSDSSNCGGPGADGRFTSQATMPDFCGKYEGCVTVAEQQVTVNGLTISVRSRFNLTTAFGYDGLRRRVSVTAPRTGTSTVTYNAAGQISAETDAAGSTTSYGYDNVGRLAWKRNALNKYARYAYNPRGQQIRVWGDTEYPVEYGYDQYGQKVTMTTFRTGTSWNGESWPNPAPQGDTTTWNYDAATGLLTSKVYADGYGPSYAYTINGKLASRTWARKDAQGNDLVTTYSYNLFGELTCIDYSDSTPDITYAYNRVGKLAQVTDVVGTRTFAYNATLDEVSETITGLYSKTLARTYTSTGLKGGRQGLSIDNVSHYTYGYDTYGRMNQITIPSGSFNYTRLADSDLVSQMTRPNGITTTWSYEQYRDLITQVQNGTISIYGYTNDAIGRRTSMFRSGSAYSNPDPISYTYNDRSELTGAQSNVDSTYSYSYAYDPIGNRITASEAGVPWTYTTNSLNQYTSATESGAQLAFAYDLDGSMTYRPVDANSGWTQIWNGENRMVETYRGTDRLTFKYDYMGRRVEKCVYSSNALTSKTLFFYDGFKCIEEIDVLSNNSIALKHFWQPFDIGLDIILATTNSSGTSYFLHDANKNIMQKTNNNSFLIDACVYAPFGGYFNSTTAHFGFSSELSDEITEMLYYNYRYYAKQIGKWISVDPKYNNSQYVIDFNTQGIFVNPLSKGKNSANNKTADLINNKLSYLTYNYICNDINRIDFLGLDAPGCDGVPDFLEIECVLECCAHHDRCYDVNKCNASSWYNPCSAFRCKLCNLEVVLCIAFCMPTFWADKGYDYYCAICHIYFNGPDLPTHLNHPPQAIIPLTPSKSPIPPRSHTPHRPGGHGGGGHGGGGHGGGGHGGR